MAERSMTWRDVVRDPPEEFPNGLCGPPGRVVLPRRWGVLALLLAACLVPRAWAAWQWDLLWADSVVYLRATEALEHHDYGFAFHDLGLNTYPIILMWLRHTGIDWVAIGEWWSVALAVLAVLPLFGWVRRQFNDQVAVVACLLYAIHPKLVGFSPLIIRDPTYWLLFNLSMYLLWRAVAEVRIRLFAGAGLTVALAAYTRSEGWLLLVPILLWPFFRVRYVPGRRVRLALGTLACLAMIPTSVVLVNVTWLHGHSRWELGRLSLFPMVWSWVCSSAEPLFGTAALADELQIGVADDLAANASAAPSPPESERSVTPHSNLVHGRKAALRIVKAFTYTYGCLILIGLWRWRRVFLHSDQQALFLHNLLLFLSIWAYQSCSDGVDLRYYLPIVMLGLPYVALGLLKATDWALTVAARCFRIAEGHRLAVAAGLLASVGLAALFEMAPSAYPVMAQQTELGRWILAKRGPNRVIVGPSGALSLLEYAAQGRAVSLPRRLHGDATKVLDLIHGQAPDVFCLWDDPESREAFAIRGPIFAECRALGYSQVPPEQLPPSCRHTFVFVKGPAPETATPETASAGGSTRR